jgi:hypothetical protein
MPVKHALAAGVTAIALLVAPVGLTIQTGDYGRAIATTSAISTAHAAVSRPTPKKAPSNGGPTFTSSGGQSSRTTGYQSGSGNASNELCQDAAGLYDAQIDAMNAAFQRNDWDSANGVDAHAAHAQQIETSATNAGCVFIY